MIHFYGSHFHLLDSPLTNGILARLCAPHTHQPQINSLVEVLYRELLTRAITDQMDRVQTSTPTRMTEHHPKIMLQTEIINPSQRAICVNLARAGTYPSHLCYDFLHQILSHENIRQDHIFASRQSDDTHHVTGASLAGSKIGGPITNAFVFFPDPMGATGFTMSTVIDYYKKNIKGPAKQFIALHLIVTPEYLRHMTKFHPEVQIYALRLDRALSSEAALNSPPGKLWEQEKGLNENDYIVPGGGGFGEIMNNSFV